MSPIRFTASNGGQAGDRIGASGDRRERRRHRGRGERHGTYRRPGSRTVCLVAATPHAARVGYLRRHLRLRQHRSSCDSTTYSALLNMNGERRVRIGASGPASGDASGITAGAKGGCSVVSTRGYCDGTYDLASIPLRSRTRRQGVWHLSPRSPFGACHKHANSRLLVRYCMLE